MIYLYTIHIKPPYKAAFLFLLGWGYVDNKNKKSIKNAQNKHKIGVTLWVTFLGEFCENFVKTLNYQNKKLLTI